MPTCGLYLITESTICLDSDEVICKIGKTENVSARLRNLQTSNSCELEVVHSVRTINYNELERIIQNNYKNRNIRGEWFKFKLSEIEQCKQYMDRECLIYTNILVDNNNTEGHVYFIKRIHKKYTSGSIICKIGKTDNDVQYRLTGLQTCNALQLKIHSTYKYPSCFDLEYIIHTIFKGNKIRGEWFEFTKEEFEYCVNCIRQILSKFDDINPVEYTMKLGLEFKLEIKHILVQDNHLSPNIVYELLDKQLDVLMGINDSRDNLTFISKICNSETTIKANHKHYPDMLKNNGKVIDQFKYNICSEVLDKSQTFTNYTNTKHNQPLDNEFEVNKYIYQCDNCRYVTNRPGNYGNHLRSIKHYNNHNQTSFQTRNEQNMKIKQQAKEIGNNYTQNLIEEIMKLKQDMKEIKNKPHQEQKEIKQEIDELIKANMASKRSKPMSKLSHILMHYYETPPLESLNIDIYSTIDINALIIRQHNRLTKTLGKFLIDHYKKDDPFLQSFWVTDISRKTYVIRCKINNSVEWHTDFQGIMISDLIINPMLTTIGLILKGINSEVTSALFSEQNKGGKTHTNLVKKQFLINQLFDLIVNDDLRWSILNYITKFFRLIKYNDSKEHQY